MTALEVAQLIQRGGRLPDAEIARLSTYDRDAWHAAIDETYRAELLAKAATSPQKAEAQPAVVATELSAELKNRIAKVVGEAMAEGMAKALEPTRARMKAIDDRIDVHERRMMDTISAMADSLSRLADAQRACADLLAAPSIAIHDERGRVVGARKEIAQDRLAALEKQIADIKAQPGLKYRGVFNASETYTKGDFATHQGGVWACHSAVPTNDRPGTTPAWQLAVKGTR